MYSTKLRTTHTRTARRSKQTGKSVLVVGKDWLDIILKIPLILLPLPAFAIYVYLKTLDHADLFLPAILSVPGLMALLGAVFVLYTAILVCCVVPSCLASFMTSTYSKGARPMAGAAAHILVVGLLAGPVLPRALLSVRIGVAALAEMGDGAMCGAVPLRDALCSCLV